MARASCANTQVQAEVPDALRGRVMAVYSLVTAALVPLGGLETGGLAERLSAVSAVRINALLRLLVTVALWTWSQLERRAAASSPGGHAKPDRGARPSPAGRAPSQR